jgi:beta-galactosidase GanA
MARLLLALAALALCAADPAFPTFADYKGKGYNVSYDKRAVIVDGQHSLFMSGAVHPPRGTPEMWDGWFRNAKDNGLNMIQVYIFWNYHEPEEGVYNWNGRGNLTLFMQKAAAADLFVNLRIGPYVCAEWTYGGIPAWLGQKPGVAFRQTNSIWQPAMEKFFNIIVKMMADGKFFATQGGPIVLLQVENELPKTDMTYVEWCGTMAHAALDANKVSVPIEMCNGQTAKSTINTCNGNDCSDYLENHGQNGRILIDQPGRE